MSPSASDRAGRVRPNLPARVAPQPPWILRRLRRESRHGLSPEGGQSLVEFALVLTPLFLILMGIIQMGFIFNAQVTLTNAVREAAREGTIYVYNSSMTMKQNDQLRNEKVRTTLIASMNMLKATAPHFTTVTTQGTLSGPVTTGGSLTYDKGDLDIAYDTTTVASASETRLGERMTITASYHQDLFFPMISAVLPRDANGRLIQAASVTMVVN